MKLDLMQRLPAHLIRRAHQRSTALFGEELADCGLTAVQYAALVAVASLPLADMTRVSQAIGFDKATLGSVIDRMEAKDLVRRVSSVQDRRTKLLETTVHGAALLARLEPAVLRVQDRLTAGLSPAQRAALIEALTILVD